MNNPNRRLLDELALATILHQPQLMFILWSLYTGFCVREDELAAHFGDQLPIGSLVEELQREGCVHRHDGGLILSERGTWLASALAVPENVDVPQNSLDLRFGVIGWGYWGPKVARNIDSLHHCRVTMVADMDENRLMAQALDRPEIRTTTHPEDVLVSDVDAIIIATPAATHFSLTREALMHGKHVLVQTPLTMNVAEAEELVHLADERNRVLMVGHTDLYSPALQELYRQIRSGELGRIYHLEFERLNLGMVQSDSDVVWDLASHDVAILLFLLGQKPVEVLARARAYIRSTIYDEAHIDIEFSSGVDAHVHVSWLHPGETRRVTLIGAEKMAVYDDTNRAEMVKIYNKGVDVTADSVVQYRYGAITSPHIEQMEPLRLECEDFANSIWLGTQPRASGQSDLEVVRTIAAIERAVSLHRPQRLDAAGELADRNAATK